MKNKIITSFFISAILLMSFFITPSKSDKEKYLMEQATPQNKYLPCAINIDSQTVSIKSISPYKDVYFFFMSSFKKNKVKVISEKDARELSEIEFRSVLTDYFRTAPSTPDQNDRNNYLKANLRYASSIIYLKLGLDSLGNMNDTIYWKQMPIPVNFGNPYKSSIWFSIRTTSTKGVSLMQRIDAIADSIMVSGKLFTE